MTVAALYIDPRGPYPKLLGPELCWDETRDARLYDGPHQVVAHPPCGPWGRLRHLYRGSEHDCAPQAVEQVRQWGGVLEHPAWSLLWEVLFLALPPPLDAREPLPENSPLWRKRNAWPLWRAGVATDGWGFTVEVDQVEWGHVARKRTWLYVVGVPRERVDELIAARPFPGREPTHYVGGGKNHPARKWRGYTGKLKCASAEQRRRTPPAFAEFLIAIAREVKL